MNELTQCLCCKGPLQSLIDFGPMPLVNTYAIKETFPLAVNRCVSCCHLQLSEFVDPEILYRDYAYQSGTGQTALDFFTEFARIALSYFPTARNVLDIASNDGTQLDAFRNHGLETHGIDPAENLAEIAAAKGHKICSLFFEEMRPEGRTFDLITAQNVIAHTPDPLKFLRKCAHIMSDHSRLFVVTSQANMIVNGECDTIYHEHISYFNAHSMIQLAKRAGLTVLDVLLPDIHGTSFIFVLAKNGEPKEPKSESAVDRLAWEFGTGMMAAPIYTWWKKHALWRIERLRRTVEAYRAQGFYLVGAGAAAKGVSMLNMAGVKLDVLVDSTPTKWNKSTNGMPILPFDRIEFITFEKTLFVILPWNLREEVRRNIIALRNSKKDVFIDTK